MNLMFEFFDVGLLGTLIGVVVGALVTRYYAVKGFRHIEEIADKTERLLQTVLRTLEERGPEPEPPSTVEHPGGEPTGSQDESR